MFIVLLIGTGRGNFTCTTHMYRKYFTYLAAKDPNVRQHDRAHVAPSLDRHTHDPLHVLQDLVLRVQHVPKHRLQRDATGQAGDAGREQFAFFVRDVVDALGVQFHRPYLFLNDGDYTEMKPNFQGKLPAGQDVDFFHYTR